MADLREDEEFHLNYPGACTIATKQVGKQFETLFFHNHLSISHFLANTINCMPHSVVYMNPFSTPTEQWGAH